MSSPSGVTWDTIPPARDCDSPWEASSAGEARRGGSPEAQRRGFAGTARAGGLSPASAKGQTPGRQAGVRREAGCVHAQLRSGSRSA